jgi:bacterioferritin-associated ferredoxin
MGMYICICNQVTDRDIQHAAAQGCASLRQLKAQTGLGTQCGSCCQDGAEVLKCCRAEMEALGDAEPAL